jgi:hypothetical protein
MNQTPPRQKAFHRSRAALAWGLGLFAALQVASALAIDLWLPQLRDPDYGYKARCLASRVRGAPPGVTTVVMLGSSRTAFGLQGKGLERRLAQELGAPCVVFNFGVTGAGPVTQLLHLKRLLAEGVRPDLLLVEVLPPLLGGQHPQPLEVHWLGPQRVWLGELSFLKGYGFPVKQIRREWWQGWPLPWYTQRFNVLSQVAPAWLPWQLRKDWFRTIDASGSADCPVPAGTPQQYRQAVERARSEYTPYLTGFRLGGPTCQALRDLLGLCRRQRIGTAMVMMPEGAAFRSLYPPAVWAEIHGYLTGLSREFEAPLIDARRWVADGDFCDSHHLRPHGAAVFSQRLAGDLVGLVRARASSSVTARLAKDRPAAPARETHRLGNTVR